MSKVDDELTRRLREAERPVDVGGLFDGLDRRRSHRERVRRVQVGLLAFAVLAATAGGFVALRKAFDPDARDVGQSPSPAALPANGEIVFSRKGEDGRFHLYASQPDGTDVRQITADATNDTDPAVSPDGRTVAYVHELDQGFRVIATIPIEGGTVTWQTPESLDASDPAWSPDGERIAFIAAVTDSTALQVLRLDSQQPSIVFPPFLTGSEDPTWSPDGSLIAFAIRDEGGASNGPWDIAMITSDASGSITTITTTDIDEEAPAWSPDGRIAFIRRGERGDEVWTIRPDGTGETLIATAVEASLDRDVAWAPDATALLVSDGEWIYRVDASPAGDPRDNFVQLVRGVSPSWQPVPADELSPTVSPELSASPSPKPEGRDIGLGFNLCHSERLDGIDFVGTGTHGTAWTGVPVRDDGRCPSASAGVRAILAADVDGDGIVDASITLDACTFCRPYEKTDLDGDGDEELVVITSVTSTPTFSIYAVHGQGEPTIAPLMVADPGHPEARIQPGAPLTFSTGGDEGFAGWVGCDGQGGELVVQITWRDHPIEGEVQEVHETDLALRDGVFHVVAGRDYDLPVGAPVPRASDEPACGVDWQLWV